MKRYLAILPIAALAACSSAPQLGTPEYLAQQHDAAVERTKAAADAPDWFVNPPKGDGFIYAAGTATSSDLQFATDKAILNAKYQMADQIAGKVSGKQKDFITEATGGSAAGTAERATSNVVADVALPGYQVAQKKVVPVDTQFRSYVLLQIPVAKPEQVASAAPAPAALQKQADAAQADLTAEVTKHKVVAFPIGTVPPADDEPVFEHKPSDGSEPPAPSAAPVQPVAADKI